MKTIIGPYPKKKISLCSDDAGPGSQRKYFCEAAYFFPGGKWVGAVRNASERLGCDFFILTTAYGLVSHWEKIHPYDVHIDEYRNRVKENWLNTIPRYYVTYKYDIMIFYAGGCPRKLYLDLLLPILHAAKVPLITFGRPNMYDIDKIEAIAEALETGTNIEELKGIVKYPERLEFYPVLEDTVSHQNHPKIRSTTSEIVTHDSQNEIGVLFEKSGRPYDQELIRKSILSFGGSYNLTVSEIIKNTESELNKRVFCENITKLMPNFKMTRRGPFKGVEFSNGQPRDPKNIIQKCWAEIGNDVVELRDYLNLKNGKKNRVRVLIDLPNGAQKEIVNQLSMIFKKLVPICIGKSTRGLVAASKVLFAVLPEIALPIDTNQWKNVFQTTDYGGIISLMIDEIIKWENVTGHTLNSCSPYDNFTLPAIYNVMAMKAHP